MSQPTLTTCQRCKASKTKCVRSSPGSDCDRCIKAGTECVYAVQKKRGRPFQLQDSSGSDAVDDVMYDMTMTTGQAQKVSSSDTVVDLWQHEPVSIATSPQIAEMFDMLFPTTTLINQDSNQILTDGLISSPPQDASLASSTDLTTMLERYGTVTESFAQDLSSTRHFDVAEAYIVRIHPFLPLLELDTNAIVQTLSSEDASGRLSRAIVALAYGHGIDMALSDNLTSLIDLQATLIEAYILFGQGDKNQALECTRRLSNVIIGYKWHRVDSTDSIVPQQQCELVRRLYWETRFLQGILCHMLSNQLGFDLANSESIALYPTEPKLRITIPQGLRFRALDALQQATFPWLFGSISGDPSERHQDFHHLKIVIESLHVVAKDALNQVSADATWTPSTFDAIQTAARKSIVGTLKIATSMTAVAAIYLYTTFSRALAQDQDPSTAFDTASTVCGPTPTVSLSKSTTTSLLSPHSVEEVFKWSNAIFDNMRDDQVATIAHNQSRSHDQLDDCAGPCSSCQFLIAAVALTYANHVKNAQQRSIDLLNGSILSKTIIRSKQLVLTNLELAQHVCEKQRWPVARETVQGIIKLRTQLMSDAVQ
ncbi:hypothetical protein OIO90_004836 [Microbotryomycetes sp. JL221]|nr:hypothetical protein OIO90_004836 [Microbotryomycetes sp. JL221]